MANTSPKKPVNDLIKFWAEKQDKKDLEPASRSLRRPLFPNASLPSTPLNENFSPFTPNSRPSTPINQSNNIHSLIPEGNDNFVDNSNSIIDIQTSSRKNEEKVDSNSLSRSDSPNEEIQSLTSSVKDIARPRDHDLNHNKARLPPVRKVTDLVSKFERVSSPINSVSTSPRLTPIRQSTPTSPLALSPIKRVQPIPEPLTLPPLNSKSRRRQTVPEPLTISLKQVTDEPTVSNKNLDSIPVSPISPISPIGNKKITPSTEQHVPEVQTQKKSTQQESISNQQIKSNNQQESLSNQQIKSNNNTSSQKKLSESIPKPTVEPSIKQSEPEPLQQKQAQPTSPILQSDYLEFLTETLKSFQTTSNEYELHLPEIVNSENGNKPSKTILEKKSHSRSKTFTSRDIKVTFDAKSISNSNKPKVNVNYENPDLLPQHEPISPIRLTFSDFMISPNGSTTNLISSDKKDVEKEKSDLLDMMSAKQTDMHKVVKPEVPKKDENSSTNKRPTSGTVQLIGSLKRYLQPNKYRNSDIIVSTRKVASQ